MSIEKKSIVLTSKKFLKKLNFFTDTEISRKFQKNYLNKGLFEINLKKDYWLIDIYTKNMKRC